MILNSFERALMNNPVRAFIQRHFEARRLLSMGGPASGGIALEIGCGRGVGSELVLNLFGADGVEAIDLDPNMVKLAQERLGGYGGRITLRIGDATDIPAQDGYYDAAFDFGIIHHVPHWRNVLREIHRVLKPGGRFYAEEMLRKFITHPVALRFFDHPQKDRFDHDEFVQSLEETGFLVRSSEHVSQIFGFFIADKPEDSSQRMTM